MNESNGLVWQNIFTIPVGCLCFVDVALEGVVDTVCWPWDSYISDARRVKPNPTNSNEVIHEDCVGEHKEVDTIELKKPSGFLNGFCK